MPTLDWIFALALIATGGIIATVTALLFARRNRPYGDPLRTRRVDVLETVAAQVGRVNHVFSKYAALAVESIRFGSQWPSVRKEEYDQVSAELAEVFGGISDAQSKLLLLGEKNVEKVLKLYSGKIAQFRREVYAGRTDFGEDQITALKSDIAQLREQFYDMLAKRYDRHLPD